MQEIKKETRSFWSTVWKYARKYKVNIFLAIMFSMLTGVAVAIQPLIIKFIVDNGILNNQVNNYEKIKIVGFYCIVFIVFAIFRMTCWGIGYRNILKFIEGFLFNIRSDLYAHIQNMCMAFYERHSSGELFNYIMGSPMNNLKNFLQQMAINVPYQMVSLIISLGAMFYFDWLLTLVLICIVGITVMINYYSRFKIKRLSKDYLQVESNASRYISDVLQGIRAVKLYAIENDTYSNFENYTAEMREKGIKLSFAQMLEGFKPEFLEYVGTALVYFVGALSCIYRGLTTGVLFAFVSSMGTILHTLMSWLNLDLLKSNAEAGLDRIVAVLEEKATTEEPEESRARNPQIEKEKSIRHHRPCISFENVTFGYENDKKIYENLSCQIDYNQSIALVGGSGSGKSTFTKLAMRLYDVNAGVVKVHGRNVNEYRLKDLRASFGIVPQDPYIFQATILENIRIARPEASMKEVIKAMEIAHVHEFVNELPRGWNTLVGEGGLGLSGGQKQRIAIARAVLGNPDILIFDEATSALDNISEKLIQQSMEELMKTHTVIIIAHRLTTIRNVDRILVFENGKIVQDGTYDELAKVEGTFNDLLTLKNE